MGDFETTVYEGQSYTEVWASALVPLFTEDVTIHHSIAETFDYLLSLKQSLVVYYHNLKFDGNFWLSYLLNELKFEQAVRHKSTDNPYLVEFLNDKDMKNNTFKYSISSQGMWYSITIKVNGILIDIKDSLKLLPFSVERIGKSFGTKHKKLDMEYTGFRYAGCEITPEEQEYIKNDVLVVKEALEIMFKEGHNKLTIGACCLTEFKRTFFDEKDYNLHFPDLTKILLDSSIYGSKNADEYIRNSYKGGWCYYAKGAENTVHHNGLTADVNSLYPSMMSSESGNVYPIGLPTFWSGNRLPNCCENGSYYFIRIKTRFYLKKDKLPCIQIKRNPLYRGTEWLETSDTYNHKTGQYCKYHKTIEGTIEPTTVVLTLTMTDFILIKEHYELVDYEILDGCFFKTALGVFDPYIEKYKKIKLESKGAIRELAKLFLNNLYGKMASSTDSSFKYAVVRDDKSIGFIDVKENDKAPGYIAIGSAITSYARNFTIRTAQKNYYGMGKRGFKYADTDSIHCDLSVEELVGVPIHDRDFCKWKIECEWDEAIFVRQKTYIEHVIKEDGKQIEKPYYNIKCAGMPERSKKLFNLSLQQRSKSEWEKTEGWEAIPVDQQDFIATPRKLTDFKVGLEVPAKLRPKRIEGGVVLVDTPYKMR